MMQIYVVRKGDTLWDICRRRSLTLLEVQQWNPDLKKNPDRIAPGDQIIIPAVMVRQPLVIGEQSGYEGGYEGAFNSHAAADLQYGISPSKRPSDKAAQERVDSLVAESDQDLIGRMLPVLALPGEPGLRMLTHFVRRKGGIVHYNPASNMAQICYRAAGLARTLRVIQENLRSGLRRMADNLRLTRLRIEVPAVQFHYERGFDVKLHILLGGVQAVRVSLVNFRIWTERRGYSGTLRIDLADHFGASEADVKNDWPGLRYPLTAMWILQHHRGRKPFVQEITLENEVEGSYA